MTDPPVDVELDNPDFLKLAAAFDVPSHEPQAPRNLIRPSATRSIATAVVDRGARDKMALLAMADRFVASQATELVIRLHLAVGSNCQGDGKRAC